MNGMNGGMAGAGMVPMQAVQGQPTAGLKVLGVLIPVVIQTPMGEVTVMAQFGEDQAANVQGLVMQLMQMGWQIKAYAPKPPSGFGGGGGNGYGGGGNGYGGGGYNGGQGGGWRPRRW